MAYAIKCDICGEYEDFEGEVFGRIAPDYKHGVITAIDGKEHRYFTCRNCAEEIERYIDTMKRRAKEA